MNGMECCKHPKLEEGLLANCCGTVVIRHWADRMKVHNESGYERVSSIFGISLSSA